VLPLTPVSRRQAFKVIAVAALGGLFIKSGSGAAFAEEGGNSACAQFCNDTFPPGPDRGECKSDAAHGTGTCATVDRQHQPGTRMSAEWEPAEPVAVRPRRPIAATTRRASTCRPM